MPKVSKNLVICLDNSGYDASPERRKIYVATPDLRAERYGQIRIADELGDDLYSIHYFVTADLSPSIPSAVKKATLPLPAVSRVMVRR
jgi:hypothetical protein